MRSKLTITFLGTNLVELDFVVFQVLFQVSSKELFPVTWGQDIEPYSTAPITYANYDAINYVTQLESLDNENLFSITRVDSIVTILSNVNGLTFSLPAQANSKITYTTENETSIPSTDLEITDIAITSGNCDDVTLEITTNIQADRMVLPFNQTVTTNPFSITYLRGQKVPIQLIESLRTVKETYITPYKLSADLINVDTISLVSGTSTTITYRSFFLDNLILEYSVDGVNYSDNNVFDLINGNHTAYIKDQFGCIVSKDFIVTNNYEKKPFVKLSKINSIRYKLVQEWDNKTIYKNDNNTLSCEATDKVFHKDVLPYQTEDTTPTQILTNYDTVTAKVINNTIEDSLNVLRKKTYLGIKDYRDCVIYERPNNRAGIYFEEGNLYDYDTSVINGSYQLYGSRPHWMKVGSVIDLESVGSLEIVSSIYDEDVSKEVIEVAYNYSGNPTFTKVKSVYDAQSYNVFEFNTVMASYEDKQIQVEITLEDNDLPTATFLSELIDVKDIQEDCVKIAYWSDENGDMLYETGIKHIKRVGLESISDNPESSITIEKDDTNIVVTDADYYESDTYEFNRLSKEVSKGLELALLHKYLEINNEAVKLTDKPEKERQGNSNMYIVKANLIKNGTVLNDNTFIDVDSELDDITVPSLISNSEGGFIAY